MNALRRRTLVRAAALVATMVSPARAMAAEPQRLAVVQDASGVTVEADGGPFASYVIDQANKPYLWPVVGPTGRSMTRAFPMRDLPEEPAAQRDHVHHRGITFGHESAGGADTWHERLTFDAGDGHGNPSGRQRTQLAALGRIVHREFTHVAVAGDRAVIEEVCDHVDPAGHPFLVELRRLTFRATSDVRTIDIDQQFACAALGGPVRFDDRKDAGLLIRVPTTMAVDSGQGGRIVNSEGLVDKDAWSKPARWCAYHGPVAGERLGIAILNHPASFRHPTRWHVRTYGLFAANPFAGAQFDPALPDGTTTLAPGDVLRLHHRFLLYVVGEGTDERRGVIEEAWKSYAATLPEPMKPAHDGR